MKINKIATLLLVIIFLVSGIAVVVNSERSNSDLQGYQINSNKGSKLYVLVNSSVYSSLEDELTTYKSDIERLKMLDVEIYENTYTKSREIRTFLRDGYLNKTLVGTFFVGNLPYEEFEISNPVDGYSRFPIDHYYTDLDGTWSDTDNNGTFDEHTAGDGDLAPEIWFGRISMKTDWAEEIQLYKNYFNKLHKYRTGELSLPHKALHYVDDDWVDWTEEYNEGLDDLYPDLTVINDKETTNASDYRQRIQEGYEWIQIHCHANHSAKRHAFKLNDGPKGSGGNFNSRDLYEDGQKSLFGNIFTCGSANYTVSNYLCGWYALTDNYGLATAGTTKPGGMLGYKDYYTPLSQGKNLGEAMKEWWIKNAEGSRPWFYGMTTIGDPTLSPTYDYDNSDYTIHEPIRIDGDEDLENQAQQEGWPGNGSEENPFVIEGYKINKVDGDHGIYVGNTTHNLEIKNNYLEYKSHHGIYLKNVTNCIINNNTIFKSNIGIYSYTSKSNIISKNDVESDSVDIYLRESTDTELTGNNMKGNGLEIWGKKLEYWNTHSIDTSNTINEKTVHYWKNKDQGKIPSNSGQVILANCTNINVENQLLDSFTGINVAYSDNINIKGNEMFNNSNRGISLYHSDNCMIENNIIVSTSVSGISLTKSNRTRVVDNKIIKNNNFGIRLQYSGENEIVENNVSANKGSAIILRGESDRNNVNRNIISKNAEGVRALGEFNSIVDNVISSNDYYGVYLSKSENISVYHNDFVDNKEQGVDYGSNNQWYNESLSEGNYWNDYTGKDSNDDGIGDEPYANIGGRAGSQDEYPLMEPYQEGKNDPPDKPSDPHPKDGTVDVDLYPVLSVNISDPDSDKLNVTFYDATDETVWFEATGVEIEKLHGRIETMPLESLKEETTYRWYVEVSDGTTTVKSNEWSFTTKKKDDTESPTADARSDKTVKVGEEFTLDGSGSSDNEKIVSYEWDLGDGTTGTGESVTHTFEETGNYTITLTVTDEAGNTDTYEKSIRVEKEEDNTPGFTLMILLFSISLILLHSYRKNKR
ncbi:MAG: NosD domain-containing protein [Thermoplasmata archaeon]